LCLADHLRQCRSVLLSEPLSILYHRESLLIANLNSQPSEILLRS
jgi:hypothetical protein